MSIKYSYFLCSKVVIEHFPNNEHSKPFKSGYSYDLEYEYYVALLDWLEIEKYYKEVIEPFNLKSHVEIDFWCRECAPGQIDISKITLSSARKNGLFVEAENKTRLTNEKNRAMIIFNLAEKFNCTPIELINKIVK
jgi:hypothetical protein